MENMEECYQSLGDINRAVQFAFHFLGNIGIDLSLSVIIHPVPCYVPFIKSSFEV